ncbi:MAG: hypothetical protein JXX14_25100 [Deltaproteobacteria bacterium]|nr:hypothetical protein [Deltaproteobacteria bacterium]
MHRQPLQMILVAILGISGCLPYLTHNRSEALGKNLNVDDTLVIAEREPMPPDGLTQCTGSPTPTSTSRRFT